MEVDLRLNGERKGNEIHLTGKLWDNVAVLLLEVAMKPCHLVTQCLVFREGEWEAEGNNRELFLSLFVLIEIS